ncbi:metal-dependent membrane protease [Streptococcus suis SC070731]|nr:metal-dependent membrane protease [Streptococcus suis SC070731]AGL48027.1 hypothetical protein TL13_1100 [Streptococcus suis TL13]
MIPIGILCLAESDENIHPLVRISSVVPWIDQARIRIINSPTNFVENWMLVNSIAPNPHMMSVQVVSIAAPIPHPSRKSFPAPFLVKPSPTHGLFSIYRAHKMTIRLIKAKANSSKLTERVSLNGSKKLIGVKITAPSESPTSNKIIATIGEVTMLRLKAD